jgi:hypothetical protein
MHSPFSLPVSKCRSSDYGVNAFGFCLGVVVIVC